MHVTWRLHVYDITHSCVWRDSLAYDFAMGAAVCCWLQHPATPCNTLQHPATRCNIHCFILPYERATTWCGMQHNTNKLQHAASHCKHTANTLQTHCKHTANNATHYSTRCLTFALRVAMWFKTQQTTNTLHHTANTLQTHCQNTATPCNNALAYFCPTSRHVM